MNWLTKLFAPKWNTDLWDFPDGPFLGRTLSAYKHKVQIVYFVPPTLTLLGDVPVKAEGEKIRYDDSKYVNQHGTTVIIDAWMPLPKP